MGSENNHFFYYTLKIEAEEAVPWYKDPPPKETYISTETRSYIIYRLKSDESLGCIYQKNTDTFWKPFRLCKEKDTGHRAWIYLLLAYSKKYRGLLLRENGEQSLRDLIGECFPTNSSLKKK